MTVRTNSGLSPHGLIPSQANAAKNTFTVKLKALWRMKGILLCCQVGLERELLVLVPGWLRLPTVPIKNMISNHQLPFDHFHTLMERFYLFIYLEQGVLHLWFDFCRVSTCTLPGLCVRARETLLNKHGSNLRFPVRRARAKFPRIQPAPSISSNISCGLNDLGTCVPQCISPWAGSAYFRVQMSKYVLCRL